MITTRIQIESYLAEYVRGKYYDETVGTVRFPSSSDIYVTVYDLMEKRPVLPLIRMLNVIRLKEQELKTTFPAPLIQPN